MPVPPDDARLARALADRAGAELLLIRAGGAAGKQLRDAGDAAAQGILAAMLADHAPKDAVLSEEAVDDLARLDAERVWIIDPLDGTREFGEPGRTDWAVHVALWSDGDLHAGAIALPALGVTYATDEPPVLSSSQGAPLRFAVSRTRPPAFAVAVALQLGAELVPMGSAGMKCAAVWRGEVDAYLHAGGQYEWDSAAPVAVARAAGLHASRIDGSALVYNQPQPALPDLIVCRPELAETLLSAVAREI